LSRSGTEEPGPPARSAVRGSRCRSGRGGGEIAENRPIRRGTARPGPLSRTPHPHGWAASRTLRHRPEPRPGRRPAGRTQRRKITRRARGHRAGRRRSERRSGRRRVAVRIGLRRPAPDRRPSGSPDRVPRKCGCEPRAASPHVRCGLSVRHRRAPGKRVAPIASGSCDRRPPTGDRPRYGSGKPTTQVGASGTAARARPAERSWKCSSTTRRARAIGRWFAPETDDAVAALAAWVVLRVCGVRASRHSPRSAGASGPSGRVVRRGSGG
jgi:hypothetical protein